MWLWSVAKGSRRPLNTMEFTNANSGDIARSLAATLRRPQGFWSDVKVAGTFRQNWDLHDYPFDRQKVIVRAEEAVDDTRSLVYRVDRAESAISPDIRIDGWKVTGFHVDTGATYYRTTFGDPALSPDSGSRYARMTATVDIERRQGTVFFKLTAGLYAAAIIALLSLFLDPSNPSMMNARIALLAGSLFAAVLSMRLELDTVGETSGLSLIDKLHICGLIFIITATLLGVVSRIRVERDHDVAAIKRFNHLGAAIIFPLFVVINVALVALAMHNG